MKIDHIEVYGFEAAIRGMRKPRDSHDRSDSTFGDCLDMLIMRLSAR